jgi:hypothetical protein
MRYCSGTELTLICKTSRSLQVGNGQGGLSASPRNVPTDILSKAGFQARVDTPGLQAAAIRRPPTGISGAVLCFVAALTFVGRA